MAQHRKVCGIEGWRVLSPSSWAHQAASDKKALLSAHDGRDERSQENVKRTVVPLLSARARFHLAVVLGQVGDKHSYLRQCHGHRALLCCFWLLLLSHAIALSFVNHNIVGVFFCHILLKPYKVLQSAHIHFMSAKPVKFQACWLAFCDSVTCSCCWNVHRVIWTHAES